MLKRTFGEKEPGQDYCTREGAYAVILEPDGNVVLVEAPAARSPQLGLFLVGGGIEPGEAPEECIRRECLEETGRQIRVGPQLCVGDDYLFASSTGDWLHVVGQCFLCELGDPVQEPIEKDHVLKRIPWQEAVETMFLHYQGWAVQVAAEFNA